MSGNDESLVLPHLSFVATTETVFCSLDFATKVRAHFRWLQSFHRGDYVRHRCARNSANEPMSLVVTAKKLLFAPLSSGHQKQMPETRLNINHFVFNPFRHPDSDVEVFTVPVGSH